MTAIPLNLKDMFRPPVDRAMKVLDRSFFRKDVSLAAARVFDTTQIGSLRISLAPNLLRVDRLGPIKPSPLAEDKDKGLKALLLKPEVRPEGRKRFCLYSYTPSSFTLLPIRRLLYHSA